MNIPDLKPDRVYVVQVRSENRFNVGEWSEGFEFETSGKGENERHHPSITFCMIWRMTSTERLRNLNLQR